MNLQQLRAAASAIEGLTALTRTYGLFVDAANVHDADGEKIGEIHWLGSEIGYVFNQCPPEDA